MDHAGPQVSVVIPTYDRADVIGSAVRSVLRQTCQDFEIIVVDDASPAADDTAGVIAGFDDARIRIARHETNQGGGGARNTGIDLAAGRYVAFLDSDDEWTDDKLEKQLAAIARVDDSEGTVVYNQVLLKGADYGWVNPDRGLEAGEDISSYLFVHEYHMQTSTLLVSRALAARIRFAEIPRHQDYDFCLRLANAGVHFEFIREPLTVFHQRAIARTSSMTAFAYSESWLSDYAQYMTPAGHRGFAVNIVFRGMVLSRQSLRALAFARRQRVLLAALKRFPVYWARAWAPRFVVQWYRRHRSA